MRTSGWGSRKYRPALTCAFWARLMAAGAAACHAAGRSLARLRRKLPPHGQQTVAVAGHSFCAAAAAATGVVCFGACSLLSAFTKLFWRRRAAWKMRSRENAVHCRFSVAEQSRRFVPAFTVFFHQQRKLSAAVTYQRPTRWGKLQTTSDIATSSQRVLANYWSPTRGPRFSDCPVTHRSLMTHRRLL